MAKYKYEFANENKEIEIGEWDKVLKEMDRNERNEQARYYYHQACSYDGILYEGEKFAKCDTYEIEEDNMKLQQALYMLTDKELRRLEAYADGKSMREIAKDEGVHSKNSIKKSIDTATYKCRSVL